MPEFEFTLTVPAGTAKDAPATLDCKLCHGIIHHYGIQFLEGCNGLVYVAIDDGTHQAFPINRDEAFHANAAVIEKTTFYPLETTPYKLKLRAWSPDCTYAHTIVARFDILLREHLEPTTILTKAIQAITKLLGVKG